MKPILFNTEMVRAILDGRKTVTRRNPFQFEFKEGQNPNWSGYSLGEYYTGHIETGACLYSRGAHEVWGVRTNVVKPKYHIGDVLYVRETWSEVETCNGRPFLIFKSDDNGKCADDNHKFNGWKPSIHMPKSAARIFLKVTDVRVERLQDITEEQAEKEGMQCDAEKYGVDGGYGCEKCENFNDNIDKCTNILGFENIWNNTIKKQDIDQLGWGVNPWVWVYEFERVEKSEVEK